MEMQSRWNALKTGTVTRNIAVCQKEITHRKKIYLYATGNSSILNKIPKNIRKISESKSIPTPETFDKIDPSAIHILVYNPSSQSDCVRMSDQKAEGIFTKYILDTENGGKPRIYVLVDQVLGTSWVNFDNYLQRLSAFEDSYWSVLKQKDRVHSLDADCGKNLPWTSLV